MEEERLEYFVRLRAPLYAVMYAALMTGAAAGAVYLVLRYGGSESVKAYLDSAAEGLSAGVGAKAVTARALKNGLFTAALFFVCGFARPGVAVIAAETARRGFAAAFTSAAFIKYYGAKGILLSACLIPQLALFAAALLLFGSVNAAAALSRTARTKKFWTAYIFFFAAAAAIFCVSALAEGFLTTIFMKFAAGWVT